MVIAKAVHAHGMTKINKLQLCRSIIEVVLSCIAHNYCVDDLHVVAMYYCCGAGDVALMVVVAVVIVVMVVVMVVVLVVVVVVVVVVAAIVRGQTLVPHSLENPQRSVLACSDQESGLCAERHASDRLGVV